MIKSFKIKIKNREESKLVQETIFNQGLTWKGGDTTVTYYSCGSEFVGLCYRSERHELTAFTDGTYDSFNKNLCPEITFEQFIKKYTNIISSDKLKCLEFVEYCMNHLNDEKTFEELYDEYILNLKSNDK